MDWLSGPPQLVEPRHPAGDRTQNPGQKGDESSDCQAVGRPLDRSSRRREPAHATLTAGSEGRFRSQTDASVSATEPQTPPSGRAAGVSAGARAITAPEQSSDPGKRAPVRSDNPRFGGLEFDARDDATV